MHAFDLLRSDPTDDFKEAVSAELRRDIAKGKAELQHAERSKALGEAIEYGHFERDPYSMHAPLKEFGAECGCVARQEKQCDGDSVWMEWVWNDNECRRES